MKKLGSTLKKITEFLFGAEEKPIDTIPEIKTQGEEFERCAICGKLTSVRKDTPVDFRDNYEVGLGQICYECSKSLSSNKKRNR